MATIHELREKNKELAAQAHAKFAEIDAADETRAADIRTESDRMFAEFDKNNERIAQLLKLEAFERAYNAPDARRGNVERSVSGNQGVLTDEQRHVLAFTDYLRWGDTSMSPENRNLLHAISQEVRDQTIGTPAAGGYLAPTGFYSTIIAAQVAEGPMLTDAVYNFTTDTGNPLALPLADDTLSMGSRVGEAQPVGTTGVTFAQKFLGAIKYTTNEVPMSSEFLQDNQANGEAFVAAALGQRMGRVLNQDLTVGTGGGTQPRGILTEVINANTSVQTANAASVGVGDLYESIHNVNPAYRPGAKFMLNDNSVKYIRKLTDGLGRPLLEPSLQAGQPGTILGYQYVVNPFMPDIASGAIPILFGDLRAYWVRQARGYALRRLAELRALTDQVSLVGFARYDGALTDVKAVKGLKVR